MFQKCHSNMGVSTAPQIFLILSTFITLWWQKYCFLLSYITAGYDGKIPLLTSIANTV